MYNQYMCRYACICIYTFYAETRPETGPQNIPVRAVKVNFPDRKCHSKTDPICCKASSSHLDVLSLI